MMKIAARFGEKNVQSAVCIILSLLVSDLTEYIRRRETEPSYTRTPFGPTWRESFANERVKETSKSKEKIAHFYLWGHLKSQNVDWSETYAICS